jgi:quercetin dioxygenase-like cupin family protein
MIIKFDELPLSKLENFNGGDGVFVANIFQDENNKILRGLLKKGCSIGLHRHIPSSETIFILSGNGKNICDGEVEFLSKGDCHYCKKGSEHTLINIGDEDLTFFAVVPVHDKGE